MTHSQGSLSRELTEAEKQLLLAAGWLRSRYGLMAGMDASKLDRENLEAFGRVWMGQHLVEWTDAYQSLVSRGYLSEHGGEFALTGEGGAARKTLEVEHPLWLYEYDNFFDAAEQSDAHALFCERVYGRNLCQHGLADLSQLDKLNPKPGTGARNSPPSNNSNPSLKKKATSTSTNTATAKPSATPTGIPPNAAATSTTSVSSRHGVYLHTQTEKATLRG
ncbi:MAG: hypothetical protein QOG71_2225 [Pyrinomonadaceae bacterium]|nr:hypothetical protein [Pyrinomonadaceae bacterium]